MDGCLLSMPEFEDVEGFPAPEDDLPRLPLESWGPFGFTALDYQSYRTERFRWGNLQFGIGKGNGEEPAFELPAGHPDKGSHVLAFYFWLFPNLMLNFYPWGLSVNIVQPLGPSRTRVSFRSWVWRDDLRGIGAGASRPGGRSAPTTSTCSWPRRWGMWSPDKATDGSRSLPSVLTPRPVRFSPRQA